MIAMPAIDLRDGACVQLVGGSYQQERVRVEDPIAQAVRFRSAGFRQLHVVDLDAATGRGSNRAVIAELLALDGLTIQIGGGVRTVAAAADLFEAGAARVVVGTRALEAPEFLHEITSTNPGRIVLALDVRGREVLARGWSEGTGSSVFDILDGLGATALAGVLVTAVHVEGTMTGVDAELYGELARRSSHRIYASGGVGSPADLELLQGLGVHAAVIGMALYTGALDAPAIAKTYRESSPAKGGRS
jgi:phosphoribosyl isomerase A